MKNFKGGSGFGGGQRFGGGSNRNHERNGGGKFGGGQNRGFKGADKSQDRGGEMFSAICSSCGRSCEVPFKPSPDKPVYCSACFGKKSQEMNREFSNKDKGMRREPEFKRDSRDERPARHEQSNDKGHEELKKQLSSLEGKVNRILDMLNAQSHEESVPRAEETTTADAPKKERKPKTGKAAIATKKVAKKATKTASKKTKK